MIIDDCLYEQYVRQRLRPGMHPDDYVFMYVSSDKNFEAAAWARLFGYSGQQAASLLAQTEVTVLIT